MVGEWITIEAPPLPPLVEDEVQLWRVDLPDETTSPEKFHSLLSSEERARAERLRAGAVRLQFVVARTCLRFLLGSVLGVAPKLVPITASRFGKPQTPGIFYNVAHSGAVILIALSRRHSVGVDVEYFSRSVDALEIAKNSFSSNEYRALSSIKDTDELRRAFFAYWTRKEAVIKADGRGLSLPLDSFEVPVGAIPPNVRIVIPIPGSEDGAEETYFVRDLQCGPEVAAAYAVAGADHSARSFLLDHNIMTLEA